MRKIRRSKSNRVLSGVLAGIAEQFNWNTSILRLLYVILTFFTLGFAGIIIYLVAAMVIPEESAGITHKDKSSGNE